MSESNSDCWRSDGQTIDYRYCPDQKDENSTRSKREKKPSCQKAIQIVGDQTDEQVTINNGQIEET